VALLFSETGDIWKDTYGTAGSAKRALYIALKHAQLAIDVLVEEDCEDGTLNEYSILYIANANIRQTAAGAIAAFARPFSIITVLASSCCCFRPIEMPLLTSAPGITSHRA
jgi:hypothetical protein